MKSGTVEVQGLKELQRELKKLDEAGLIDKLKDLNFKVAEFVIGKAQGRASTRLQAAAAASLTASRQAARAQVNGGGGKVPFFGGAEFGAAQGQQRQSVNGSPGVGFNQFEPWRGNGGDAGYFLYPAIRDATDDIVDMYGDEMEQITKEAFPD